MGKTILLSGGSSGIGRHLAMLFGQEAGTLILLGRRKHVLRDVAAEVSSRYGTITHVWEMDLSRSHALPDFDRQLNSEGIVVDVLVNCAGIGFWGEFAELSLDDQLRVVRLNVSTLTGLCRRLLPSMLTRNAGGILNVASTAGFVPGPGMAVYYATKAFVLSMSEALAEEVRGTGVTVTCLAPGPTATPFLQTSGQHRSRLHQRGAMPVEKVARAGYQGFLNGRTLVVPGASNQLSTFAVRFLPRPSARKIVRWLKSPASAADGPSRTQKNLGDR